MNDQNKQCSNGAAGTSLKGVEEEKEPRGGEGYIHNIPNIPRTATWTIFHIHSSVTGNEVVQQLI